MLSACLRWTSAGIARDHPESYHTFMWQHLFKHIDIDPNNAHILDGNAPDLQAECDRFEKLISDAGGIQLFIGGTYVCHVVTVCILHVALCMFVITLVTFSSQHNCPVKTR